MEGVPSAVAAASDAVDAVLRDRGMRTISADQRGRALLAGARANAALSEDPALWAAGAVRLAGELVELAGTIRIAPAQALARAHVVIARGIVTDDELGRVSGGAAVQERIAGLVDLLTGPQTASAIVLGAIVHAEIATAAPFGPASGLIARAAEHLVLISSGLDPAAVIVVEAGPCGERRRLSGRTGRLSGGQRGWSAGLDRSVRGGGEPGRGTVTGQPAGGHAHPLSRPRT